MGHNMQLFELEKDGHLLVECSLLILGQGFCGWCRLWPFVELLQTSVTIL